MKMKKLIVICLFATAAFMLAQCKSACQTGRSEK